jgi:hypothetical protein
MSSDQDFLGFDSKGNGSHQQPKKPDEVNFLD